MEPEQKKWNEEKRAREKQKRAGNSGISSPTFAETKNWSADWRYMWTKTKTWLVQLSFGPLWHLNGSHGRTLFGKVSIPLSWPRTALKTLLPECPIPYKSIVLISGDLMSRCGMIVNPSLRLKSATYACVLREVWWRRGSFFLLVLALFSSCLPYHVQPTTNEPLGAWEAF